MKAKYSLLFIAITVAFLLCMVGTTVLAQGEVPAPYVGLKNPFPWTDTLIQEKGKEQYGKLCSGCHGVKVNTLVNVDFGKADYWQVLEEKPALYFWILSEGKSSKGMPAFKASLSEEQRWQILTFVRSVSVPVTSQKTTPPAPDSKSSASVPPKLTLATESDSPLDCMSCHKKELKGHDKLGSGNAACWSCHNKNRMDMLTFASGTSLPLADSSVLCGQCHQKRYDAWNEGEHGIPDWKNPAGPGSNKTKCVDCHNPHQPQIVLSGITRPHPQPLPLPPPTPNDPLIIVGIAFVVFIGIGIGASRKG